MVLGLAFKVKGGKRNHLAAGSVDCIDSLCGSAFYDSKNPKARRLGERMPLDRLVRAHSNLCSRCVVAAERLIESEEAWEQK